MLRNSLNNVITSLQMALHFDPSSAILKSHGKYAGPMAEIEVRTEQTARLTFTGNYSLKKKKKSLTEIILCKPFVDTFPDMTISPSALCPPHIHVRND